MNGIVYTETVIHSAPARLMAEAPYQIAIVTLESGRKLTGRVEGERVKIGDRVQLADTRGGVPWFRRTD